tara:strand:- start:1291 stop:2229 length:939 start_codon:yes stop_codon:yes gene_type:complete
MNLIKGDCLVELKKLKNKSVDFVFLDLPYGQTACDWDKKIDLNLLWIELKRIAKNDRTPFFFTTTTKFGYELIKANEKWFRWDLVWEKNRAAGFLNAYRLPMRKHEMVYCFAKKSPAYDVSSHKFHYENNPRPRKTEIYGKNDDKKIKAKIFDDPLPTSVIPPQEDHELVYCFAKKSPAYDVSSHNEGKSRKIKPTKPKAEIYGMSSISKPFIFERENPLPTSICPPQDEQPSSWCKFSIDQKTGHRTAKPIKLMEYLLKYWSKEGDTILDPTMGSGSMGIACKNMNRKFIGIELNEDIYHLGKKRINDYTK